ncbi:hypothetical protein StoSoilB13_19440 [Arthrobacter sp. StoSoilB13]|nr:hypothetical protein StoSoilB13_19440 [Arthrobacter sp. StoSoilB13]
MAGYRFLNARITSGRNDPARVGNVPTVREPRRRAGDLVEVVTGRAHLPHHLAGMPGEHLARFCWHHATRTAGEKRLAYFLFELP